MRNRRQSMFFRFALQFSLRRCAELAAKNWISNSNPQASLFLFGCTELPSVGVWQQRSSRLIGGNNLQDGSFPSALRSCGARRRLSGETFFGGCHFDFAIYLRAKQNHQASNEYP